MHAEVNTIIIINTMIGVIHCVLYWVYQLEIAIVSHRPQCPMADLKASYTMITKFDRPEL